jgi:hypothetical protein
MENNETIALGTVEHGVPQRAGISLKLAMTTRGTVKKS